MRIVENGLPKAEEFGFLIDAAPLVVLDGERLDPDHELDHRRPFFVARPLSDGRWAVLDVAAVVITDQAGKFIRAIGARGAGPGEFRQLRELCITEGDTIVAVSLAERRIAVFDSSGRHLRTRTAEGQVRQDPCVGGGELLVRGEPTTNPHSRLAPPQAALFDRVASIHRTRWDGTRQTRLGLMPVESADVTFADSPNIVGSGDRIVVGNGSDAEYRVYDLEGRLTQIVRWSAARTAVTTGMRAAALRRGFRDSAARRDFLPHYRALRVSVDGFVWVQEYFVSTPKTQFFAVFRPDGVLAARVRVPVPAASAVDVPWIGPDRLLLAWRETDGTPHLSVHRLRHLH